jgi:hypothetical protein
MLMNNETAQVHHSGPQEILVFVYRIEKSQHVIFSRYLTGQIHRLLVH